MAKLELKNNQWELIPTREQSVLQTKDKYVDKNIKIQPVTEALVKELFEGITIYPPTTGDNHFYIEVPNGPNNSMIKFWFYVDSNSNVYILDARKEDK